LQGDRQAEPAIHRVTRQEPGNQLVVFSEKYRITTTFSLKPTHRQKAVIPIKNTG